MRHKEKNKNFFAFVFASHVVAAATTTTAMPTVQPESQCDQVGRFIVLWQQLICQNLSNSQAIFVKVSKSIIFLVKSFLGNFNRHMAIFSGHAESDQLWPEAKLSSNHVVAITNNKTSPAASLSWSSSCFVWRKNRNLTLNRDDSVLNLVL